MASYNKFDAFVANLANGAVNLGSDSLNVILTNTLPLRTNSAYADVSGGELPTGSGYIHGGAHAVEVSSGQAGGLYKLVLMGTSWLASGGSIGPFQYAVLYDTAGGQDLIGWWDNGTPITLTDGKAFIVTFDASNGVLQIQ